MAPMSTSTRNNVRNRDGTTTYNSKKSPRRDDGIGDDNDNSNSNDYDYTTTNRNNDIAAVPAGLRRRRKNGTRRSSVDNNDDAEKKYEHSPPKAEIGRFAPPLYPFIHINEVPAAVGGGGGGFSTPPRTPSPKPTTNRRDNNDEKKEIDDNEFHREEPKLKNPFSSSVPPVARAGTESTANLNSSRSSIFAELNCDYNNDDDCSINNNNDKQMVRFDEDTNFDEEEGYKKNDSKDGDDNDSNSSSNNKNNDDNERSTALTTAKSFLVKIQRSRYYIGGLVNNEFVQLAIILLIVTNAIMMGLATMDWVKENPEVSRIFRGIDKGFLVIFTIEISMQLYYFGIALFQDGWLVFDLVIVTISWAFESLQVIRAFRIFRAFRLVTRVKPLRDLILAIGQVLPRMTAIGFLLIIIFYVFAVLFTELFSDLELSANYFNTLEDSLFTCMQMMTLEWGDVTREVMEETNRWWAWIPFVSYIALSGFVVFNLIVAVVVQAVAATEETVRALDGIESDNPIDKLNEAQERIDLLQHHLDNMMIEQEHIQSMLETMAGEFLNLASERMKAEYRETKLRDEINRRIDYQKKMESKQKEEFQQHQNQNQQEGQDQEPQASLTDRERKESERREKVEDMYQSLSSSVSLHNQSFHGSSNDITRTPRTRRKKAVIFSDRTKPEMVRDNSGTSLVSRDKSINSRDKSIGSTGDNSCPDALFKNSPKRDRITQSAPTNRKKLDLNAAQYSTSAAAAAQGQSGKESINKAKAGWKSMLAIKQL